jgi:hypothetical protein
MAINLWKIGGKPTSYNPLPTGYTNGVVLEIGDYIYHSMLNPIPMET